MKAYPARLWIAPLVLAFGSLWAAPAAAQEPATREANPAPEPAACPDVPAGTPTGIATSLDDLARVLEIGTDPRVSRVVRRHSEARWPGACAEPVPEVRREGRREGGIPEAQFTIRPIRSSILNRSGYPDDRNNGALWAGRGLSTMLELGLEVKASVLSAAIVPQLVYQQNRGFDFPTRNNEGFSPFIYPHYTTHIDLPHRHGSSAFANVEWGQSYVRADARGLAAGISTESLWWGPAARYPILMSNSAPGMPHIFMGTSGALDVRIGHLDAEVIIARASESEYFDQIPENDHHMIGGLVAAFSPRPLPGLWVGLVRVNHYTDDGWGALGDLLASTTLPGSGGANQIVSVFGRWVLPDAGAEVYGEWAREDRSYDVLELMQEPDHSQAYMLGFQKLTPVHDLFGIRVQGELVALQELPELRTGSRPLPVYYTHDEITQGHTHRGQSLGAGIGPGGDAQFIAVDAMADMGSAGVWVERVRRATFSARALDLRSNAPYEHDTELTRGIRGTFLAGGLSVAGSLAYTFRYNRDFRDDDTNWSLGLEATWIPGTGFDLAIP